MPASAAYLTKYLNAGTTNSNGAIVTSNSTSGDFEDSNRPKKRRKKDKNASSNAAGSLFIADDDEGLLLSTTSKSRNAEDDGDDDPLIYTGTVKNVEFRKKKSSAWRAVGEDANGQGQGQDQNPTGNTTHQGSRDEQDADEATRILNAAAAESAQRTAMMNDEDAPTIVDDVTTTNGDSQPSRILMSSGAPAGLQTAADTARLAALQGSQTNPDTSESHSTTKKKRRKQDNDEPEQETIYRDASGRRIDLSQARSQAQAAATAKAAAEKQSRDDAMGEVQLRAREESKKQLEEARYLTLARDVDDVQMNEELKGQVRWDDPMAGYMAEKRREERAERGGGGDGDSDDSEKSMVRRRQNARKEYNGAAPPNRYGIKPGWRWDGVDRGTGFEKEWFQARGRKTRNENLEYQWAYDE